jgi:AraC-like DNA-binding protein
MDVLSDVLREIRLTGAVYFDLHPRAPWVAATPPGSVLRGRVMPGFERIIMFHMVLDGAVWAYLEDPGTQPIHLETGDVIITSLGSRPHFMGSEPGLDTEINLDIYRYPSERSLPYVFRQLEGDGPSAHIACGYFGCDARPFNPILSSLPEFFTVHCGGRDGELIRQLFDSALQESKQPHAGGEGLLSRLSEVMFLHGVRQYIDTLPAGSSGWLAGLRDPQVSMALRLMHGSPQQAWTLEQLASEIGMSRSALAEHFSRVMGVPVMHYLANWRLQLAAGLLDRPGLSIDRVAEHVGYDSTAAFSRAFKRQVGMSPGAWRRRIRPDQGEHGSRRT